MAEKFQNVYQIVSWRGVLITFWHPCLCFFVKRVAINSRNLSQEQIILAMCIISDSTTAPKILMSILIFQYGILTIEKWNASYNLVSDSQCFTVMSKQRNETFKFDVNSDILSNWLQISNIFY